MRHEYMPMKCIYRAFYAAVKSQTAALPYLPVRLSDISYFQRKLDFEIRGTGPFDLICAYGRLKRQIRGPFKITRPLASICRIEHPFCNACNALGLGV